MPNNLMKIEDAIFIYLYDDMLGYFRFLVRVRIIKVAKTLMQMIKQLFLFI